MPKRFLSVAALLAASIAHATSTPQWVEVRSDHFIVVTDSNEKQARHLAGQFERMRLLFNQVLPHAGKDEAVPITVLALKDKKGFQSLEPSAYLQKNSLSLAGLFLRTPDQNYILLSLDSQNEDHPFATVYHEYTHFVLRKAEFLPLWLNEGLAEFYQNTDIQAHDALVGQPSAGDIQYLRDNKLLPLATLFAVDHDSPYYHDEQKGSVFYSESWALTHFIEITDFVQHTHRLQDYAHNVANHQDPVTAATNAFGDLGKLQKQLQDYINGANYQAFRMNLALSADEASFRAPAISTAEANAIRADVLVWDDRRDEAKTLLEATLAADPKNALAHESMGSLCFSEHDNPCAKKWFGEAVKLDSTSYIANYYYAVLTMEDNNSLSDDAIEASLNAAIKLQPTFAPSYDALAHFYATRNKDLDKARLLTVQAVQLEPEEISYRIDGAQILFQEQQFSNALNVLKAAKDVAKSPEEKTMVQGRIDQIQKLQDQMAQFTSKGAEATITTSGDGSYRVETHMKGQVVANPGAEAPEEIKFTDALPTAPKHKIAGVLHNVKCSYPTVLTMDVERAGKTTSLFVNNYFKVEFTTSNYTPQGDILPCSAIDGMKASVTYADAPGKDVVGQILAIELSK